MKESASDRPALFAHFVPLLTFVMLFPPRSGSSIMPNNSNISLNGAKILQMPVSFKLADGHKERWRQDEQQITEVFIGAWTELQLFIEWCLGYTLAKEDSVVLNRIQPAQHIRVPWLYATDVELLNGMGAWSSIAEIGVKDDKGQPLKDGDGNPVFPEHILYRDSFTHDDLHSAKVAVTFRSLPYEIRSNDSTQNLFLLFDETAAELYRHIIRESTYAIQSLPLPANGYKYVTGAGQKKLAVDTVPENAAQLLFPTQTLKYTWVQVPDPPYAAIESCIGKVNDRVFDGALGARSYKAETLLCMPPQIQRKPRNATGHVSWDVIYSFMYRPKGWNFLPANAGGTFDYYLITSDGTANGSRPYQKDDFNQLFITPQPPVVYQ